ncbi:MAG: adenosylcobinamide-phosphate synthase CbiB [Actinomycetota bacterium]
MRHRGLAVALGLLGDRLLGEPPDDLHPVAWFGTAMTRLEDRIWKDDRRAGVAYAACGTAIGAVSGSILRSTTAAVGIAAAGRQLRTVATSIGSMLEDDDLDAARDKLPWLVGRDPSELDASGVAAAVIESLAENSVDAVVAPVFWGLVAGAPGALAHRAINTMDAMVGHKSDRYRNFGWAAARLDDAANYVPARLFALVVAIQQPSRAASIIERIRSDAPAHPSPNAGVAETAVSAALGIELGGALRYGELVENRPHLGVGPRPSATDIERAVATVDRAELLLVVALLAGWATRRR